MLRKIADNYEKFFCMQHYIDLRLNGHNSKDIELLKILSVVPKMSTWYIQPTLSDWTRD